MTLRVAIVADDLTGALDTSVPFVCAGLSTVVAVTADALDEAIDGGAEVIAVNTGSRAMAADDAARRLTRIADRLASASPEILLKKIDSRLKGNITAETGTLAAALGRSRIVVAPAVPDQRRFTVDGCVVGDGVDRPLPIAPLFAELGAAVEIADAASDADLDEVAVSVTDADTTLFVGARGLGASLAGRLGRQGSRGRAFPRSPATLFAIGSRDPITDAQIDHLVASAPHVLVVPAPDGTVPEDLGRALPMVLRCTGPLSADTARVATRFAAGVGRVVDALRPETLIVGGGDTASAVLSALGVRIVRPLGEAAPGLPWFEIPNGKARRRTTRCVAKSGGFGTVTALADLIGSAQSDAFVA